MRSIARFLAAVSTIALAGCQSLPPQPPMDLSEPGWTIRQGQAVWKTKPGAEGIAGDLLVAMHWNGRNVVQFTKPPMPFVAAQSDTNHWQIQYLARKKNYSGRGQAPDRILWLQLPDNLATAVAVRRDTDWSISRQRGGTWQFTNMASGESLDGFLVTTKLPPRHRVMPGEHPLKIARRYGITMEALRAVNPGPDAAWFQINAEINLPQPAATPQP
jgi:LysM repeat protein